MPVERFLLEVSQVIPLADMASLNLSDAVIPGRFLEKDYKPRIIFQEKKSRSSTVSSTSTN